jgi:predicted nuclease of predicted toxin-antitoxin system
VKLLLDEMLSPAIARELRDRGHDAQAIGDDPARKALSDPEVLALAQAEHRAVVTNNLRDFRPLHNEAITPGGPGHYGMIFIPGTYRLTRNDTGKITTALEQLLTQHPGETDLADGEAWL